MTQLNSKISLLRTNIAIPQDHGSWVFILSPLLIGLFAGETFSFASIALVIAAMSGFLIRQPVTAAVKSISGRRPRNDIVTAGFWIFIYGLILIASVVWMFFLNQARVIYLALPALPIFAWHLFLVSRREERKQAGVEIIATGVLALSAPAAFWIGNNNFSSSGWIIWVLTWFQSAASIVYAYQRLKQKEWKTIPDIQTRITAGHRALAYTLFNLALALFLSIKDIIPHLVWLAYLVQVIETIWGTIHPAVGAKPVKIGVRQLFISIIYTVLFILFWRYG